MRDFICRCSPFGAQTLTIGSDPAIRRLCSTTRLSVLTVPVARSRCSTQSRCSRNSVTYSQLFLGTFLAPAVRIPSLKNRSKRNRDDYTFNWIVKIELIVLTLFLLGTPTFARTQDRQLVDGVPVHNGVPETPDAPEFRYIAGKPGGEGTSKPPRAGYQFTESAIDSKPVLENIRSRTKFNSPVILDSEFSKNAEEDGQKVSDSKIDQSEKFHWKSALIQSAIFLGIQHGVRVTKEAKTRRELDGKFFKDWGKSVRGLRGWHDSDGVYINYIGHPLQGALTGRIFVNNSDSAKKQEFGKSKKYWRSRAKAMIWSAAWSAQFELGPLSEATIGNVGMRERNGHSTMAWGDLLVTPILGTGVLILEDLLDKYILRNWIEKKLRGKFLRGAFRIVLNPTTSLGNVLQAKKPYWRQTRKL